MQKLPTYKRHCTITFDDGRAVTYATPSGVIDSPSTTPWQLLHELFPEHGGRVAFGRDEDVRTEEVAPHVFRMSCRVEATFGREISPHHTDYADPVGRVGGTWFAHVDYTPG